MFPEEGAVPVKDFMQMLKKLNLFEVSVVGLYTTELARHL